MEPKFEPKQHTPEEIAALEKSRTVSDVELLKGGAEYVVGEEGEKKGLSITDKQVASVEKEMSLVEKIKAMLPIGEKFPVYFKPNEDSDIRGPQHKALFTHGMIHGAYGSSPVVNDVPMGKVNPPTSEKPYWTFAILGETYEITDIGTGIQGVCVTIGGKENSRYEKRGYFYTGVSSEDKNKRIELEQFPGDYEVSSGPTVRDIKKFGGLE